MGWWSRFTTRSQVWVRQVLAGLPALRRAPPLPGGSVTGARVASSPKAEQDLGALASSPTVFAAVNRRAFTLSVYPIRCLWGYSIGGTRARPLDPERVLWVGSFLRLLQIPNPAESEELFPEPGESLIAQIVADLLLAGNAFVVPTLGEDGGIVGLTRLHPELVVLERRAGEEFWVYRSGTEMRRYPRRSVAHMHLLSWEKGAQGALGTGAGRALRPLVDAEETALQQTANVVEQGGADVRISAKSTASASFLTVKANREQVAKDAVTALSGEAGRRVFVVGGDFQVEDAGLQPADLRAPELLAAARGAELMAVGVVPVAVGAEAGTYATAVQQYRVQAEQDEALVGVIEAGLLRPLARHFARRAGGMWGRRADQVTARIDLASHPGYAYLRTDAINRMEKLVRLGWTSKQAAEIEGLDLPEPEGEVLLAGPSPGTPGPVPGETKDPRRPVGDADEADPADPNEGRRVA